MSSDTTLDFHVAALEEIERDIAVLESGLQLLRCVAAYHRERIRGGPTMHPAVLASAAVKVLGQLPAHRFAAMSAREAARVILEESGRPMRAAEIVDHIAASGKEIPDRMKAINSIFTMLGRAPEFVKVAAGLWDLKTRTPVANPRAEDTAVVLAMGDELNEIKADLEREAAARSLAEAGGVPQRSGVSQEAR